MSDGLGAQVVVATDEPIVLEAVQALLRGASLGTVDGRAGSSAAVAAVAAGGIAVIDVGLLEHTLASTMAGLADRGGRLCVFGGSSDLGELQLLMTAGVHGYLARTALSAELISGVRTVLAGGRHVPAELLAGLAERLLGPVSAPATAVPLTPRELDVLRLAATGETTAGIGRALYVSPSTAKTHLQNAYAKLGVRNRSAAIAWLAAAGALEPGLARAA